MPDRTAEQHSVVLLGAFNPMILQPQWPPLTGLLKDIWGLSSEDIGEDAVIMQEVCRFKIESVFLQAERSRFQIIDDAPAGRSVADFAERLFGQHLPHTPVNAIGVNYQCTVLCKDLKERDRIGYAICPPAPWGEYQDALSSKEGGLIKQTVKMPLDLKGFDAARYVTVSAEESREQPRFTVRVNNHFGLPDGEKKLPVAEALPLVLKTFDLLIENSTRVAATIMNMGKK